MTDNELAKLHIRHLVGGRAAVPDEVLYRFEFPERPGALLRFLNQMGERWNISLFHYRNHGAADGRVLAGIQVAPADAGCLPASSSPSSGIRTTTKRTTPPTSSIWPAGRPANTRARARSPMPE